MHRFASHRQSDDGKHYRAGVTAQSPDFSRAEAKSCIVRVPTRNVISEGRYDEGDGVGAHVPPVCEQRH